MNLVDIRTAIAVTVSATLAAAAIAAPPAAQAREVGPQPWFAPIAAYYQHDPRITPRTNYAQLEFGI